MFASAPRPVPAVLVWYRAYAVAMALLYLATAGMGVAALITRDRIADADTPPAFILVFAAVVTLLGLLLMAVYVAALLLPPRPWVWIYHLVLIAIGLTSACCLPACIPLLIFWLKPETRAFFGRN